MQKLKKLVTYPVVMTNMAIEAMTIEIESFPMKNCDLTQSKLLIHQRVCVYTYIIIYI